MSLSFVFTGKGNIAKARRKEGQFPERLDDMEEWRKQLGRDP